MEDLEFDHVNPATKVFTLTNGHKYPKAKIKDELAKCQLLCSECHDKKTAKERAVESPHGTINQYYNHRCRCELCRAAYSTYRKKLRARIVQSG
jgi:5-methylcytosine-specific restriction endonuclease McrA